MTKKHLEEFKVTYTWEPLEWFRLQMSQLAKWLQEPVSFKRQTLTKPELLEWLDETENSRVPTRIQRDQKLMEPIKDIIDIIGEKVL
ncbi:hypothetical protein COT75_00820 [Candidatus Beckwithbacteria bacterium CG10_big_fil_rev_8_21_14_0_10_34_10]|uniref:Uncharacterized protein n=1 Tax=Candidatus Beckwithbacteria bacterium CG10_big_fil_rev_8_21_14_0_10_34_10 TaxID=1974495 RepID=A0A2H0WCD6_9BACT|nr:MAG: hypothetical protein COT75_00820 [Candidatus Beckwithbacteria bacterium CG10_big_fil_rev_8_21_14_0_10_34_10]